MVILDVGSEQPFEMTFVNGNHVVQQLAATASDPALGDTVLPRATNCRSDRVDVHRANGDGNFGATLGIVINDTDQPNRDRNAGCGE